MNEEMPKPEDFGINGDAYKKLQERVAYFKQERELGEKENNSIQNWTFWFFVISGAWFIGEKRGFPSDIWEMLSLLILSLFLSLYISGILFGVIVWIGSLLFTSERYKKAKKVLDELELKHKESVAPFEGAIDGFYEKKLDSLRGQISNCDPTARSFNQLILEMKKVFSEAEAFSKGALADMHAVNFFKKYHYEDYFTGTNGEARKKEYALSEKITGEKNVAPSPIFEKTDFIRDGGIVEENPTSIAEKRDLAEDVRIGAREIVEDAEVARELAPVSRQPSFFARIRESLPGGRFKKSGGSVKLPSEKSRRIPRKTDWEEIMRERMATGATGEDVVMLFEKEYLSSMGRNDLAGKVRHVSRDGGDGFGYDIASFFPDGEEKYIEVKTTKSSFDSPYYISRNELGFLRGNSEKFFVYRVLISETDAPEVEMIPATDILENSELIPINYMVKGR